jgi:hypothetical protein
LVNEWKPKTKKIVSEVALPELSSLSFEVDTLSEENGLKRKVSMSKLIAEQKKSKIKFRNDEELLAFPCERLEQ